MKICARLFRSVVPGFLVLLSAQSLIAMDSQPFPLEATMICALRPEAPPQSRATVFVIRGGGGYFPNLGTVINRKFEDQGLDVVDFRYHERSLVAQKISRAYREGKLPHGVIMIGYSLGGCGVINVARTLKAEGIPVRLLYLIETINPVQTVPSNVQECFNLYHFPAILGSAVRAESKSTKLVNFEAYRDGGLGLEYSHFTMPFVEEVHQMVAAKLMDAIRSQPTASLEKALTPVSGASPGTRNTASSADSGRPGLFQRLRRKS